MAPNKKSKIKKDMGFLEDIVSNIIGKPGSQVVNTLYKKKNVNEFLISRKLNMTINQTRNLLYKLSDNGLVSFIRKKDAKKGGWYTYFWTLNNKRALELFREQVSEKIRKIEEEFQKRKNERYYYSPGSGLEYNEEEALEYNFICPETGEVLALKDSKLDVDKLDIEISKLKILREEMSEEIDDMEKKIVKNKEKSMIEEQRIKEKERERKRKENAKNRRKKKTQKSSKKKK